MNKAHFGSLATALALTAGLEASPMGPRGFDVDVVMEGARRPEYVANGTVYVEAVKGREYQLRLTNPTGSRVAVALAVDGLNTIDAKHTDARTAAKWVLDPYETVTIAGWQVSGSTARRFTFTTEGRSFGAYLGETENLGTIEAVFYREKLRPRPVPFWKQRSDDRGGKREQGAPPSASAAPEPRDAPRMESQGNEQKLQAEDEYAATGMGERVDHDVTRVDIELEREPAARVRIRYEFRPQLVKMGILPKRWTQRSPIERREAARGFEGFSPEMP